MNRQRSSKGGNDRNQQKAPREPIDEEELQKILQKYFSSYYTVLEKEESEENEYGEEHEETKESNKKKQ